jgi:hypothetical protein
MVVLGRGKRQEHGLVDGTIPAAVLVTPSWAFSTQRRAGRSAFLNLRNWVSAS